MSFFIHIQIFQDPNFLGWLQDAQLVNARLERDSRRQQKEDAEDEKDKLVAHIELLKRSVHTPLCHHTFTAEINTHT